MKILNEDIRNHTFKRAYLLYGEEAFLKKSYKNQMIKAVLGEDTINLHAFYGKDTDIAEVISLADTMPFFAPKRLILIENSGLFKREAEKLASYLPDLPESSVILFVEDEVDKRNKLFKKVKEVGYAAELARQPEAQLKSWILKYLKQENRQISRDALEVFLGSVGDDMIQIRSELDKLIAYTEGKEGIYPEDVQAVCSVQITGQIFEMIRNITDGKQKEALDQYYDLLALKEPPMRILFLIARQFNQLLMVKELMGAGKGKEEIAKKAGLMPFAASRVMGQSRKWNSRQLKTCVEQCVEAEEAVKTGRMTDILAVELVITSFVSRTF